MVVPICSYFLLKNNTAVYEVFNRENTAHASLAGAYSITNLNDLHALIMTTVDLCGPHLMYCTYNYAVHGG